MVVQLVPRVSGRLLVRVETRSSETRVSLMVRLVVVVMMVMRLNVRIAILKTSGRTARSLLRRPGVSVGSQPVTSAATAAPSASEQRSLLHSIRVFLHMLSQVSLLSVGLTAKLTNVSLEVLRFFMLRYVV